MKQIAFNAGLEGSVIVEKRRTRSMESDSTLQPGGVDMMKNGIVDPAKVVRTALQMPHQYPYDVHHRGSYHEKAEEKAPMMPAAEWARKPGMM
jgi:hypothetical protein